ncbi:MAG: hypothetical protein EPO26_19055 [Chloroflexota bacterium]|nr:MAG: hypothetical protein EPO26_19055 [Chloroflexota bacterium]
MIQPDLPSVDPIVTTNRGPGEEHRDSPATASPSVGSTIVAILAAREAERTALAEILRDDVAQSLAGLAMSLDLCARAIAVNSEMAREEIDRARASLGDTIGRLRRRIYESQPRVLDDAALGQVLRRYAAQWNELSVEVVDRGDGHRLGIATEGAFYRIVQIALHDAASRGATRATIELGPDAGITIESDASGEPSPTAGDAIHEWTRAIGADADVALTRIAVRLTA